VRTYTLAAGMRVDVIAPADGPRGLMWSEHASTLRVRGVRVARDRRANIWDSDRIERASIRNMSTSGYARAAACSSCLPIVSSLPLHAMPCSVWPLRPRAAPPPRASPPSRGAACPLHSASICEVHAPVEARPTELDEKRLEAVFGSLEQINRGVVDDLDAGVLSLGRGEVGVTCRELA
jgi:hypothetical protein